MRITKRMIRKLLVLSEKPQRIGFRDMMYAFYNPCRNKIEEWGIVFNGEYYYSLEIQHYSPLECAYDGLLDWYKKNGVIVYDN